MIEPSLKESLDRGSENTDETVGRQELRHSFDWNHPLYAPVWAKRISRLAKIRGTPGALPALYLHYKSAPDGIASFINDWGVTVDPRNAGTDRPVIMPFVLFPRQREFVSWLIARWRGAEDGELVKSRDCGASWLAMAAAVSLCRFFDDLSIGFGSAIKTKVDNAGDPDSLFYKGRMFIRYLPREFRGPWNEKTCSADMRIIFPDTHSSITGECGDKIGRGGRKSIYVVDEFAFVERPKLVDANLIANTDCRIEMSSVNGTANVFAERARGGRIARFDFHYRDDPRKVNAATGELYTKFAEKRDKADPVIWAQEYECDFLASVEGIIIPQEWVQAAIGAAAKLGIVPSGVRRGAFDVADQGKDKLCYGTRHGIEINHIESWSGKGSDIFQSVQRAFGIADDHSVDEWCYDADGMGASVRGDAKRVNDDRAKRNKESPRLSPLKLYRVAPFRGSGAVKNPESAAPGTERKNLDFFENFKAQAWWSLRQRFLLTFRTVTGVTKEYNPSDLISISRDLPELQRTCSELSQPVRAWSKSGKMMIDKTPDDVASPNNADVCMMLFGYEKPPMRISSGLVLRTAVNDDDGEDE